MIAWNENIKKTNAIFQSVAAELLKQKIDIDGVIEIFNNGKEQGTLLKVFDKYIPEVDLCFWAYLPSDRSHNNQMQVIVGHHSDCNDANMWNDSVKIKTFTNTRARNLHDEVRDYIINLITSTLDKKINSQGGLNNE